MCEEASPLPDDAGHVRTRILGPVLEVRFQRPPANAIDPESSRQLGRAFEAFRDDARLRVAVLTGEGRFFSAGWDLKYSAASRGAHDFGPGGFGGLQHLPGLNKPVIAAVNGMAVGGGFELALAADMILCSADARFALPEIRAGTLANSATIRLHRRIPYHVAMELLYTGRWMDAAEAHRLGLVNEVVPAAELRHRALALAATLAEGPPLVFAAIKEVVRETEAMPFADAARMISERAFPTVATLFDSEDQREGARAFAEKRPPVWRGK